MDGVSRFFKIIITARCIAKMSLYDIPIITGMGRT